MISPGGIKKLAQARDFNNTTGSGTDGYVLAWDNGTGKFVLIDPSTIGTTDHGALTGLTDDDHTQYVLADGSRAGATSQAQAFTSGVVGPTWRPASDSTTALQLQNAAGTENIITIDTTNNRVGINTTPSVVPLKIQQTGDTQGIRVYGFDDQSSEYIAIAVNSSGTGFFSSTSGMNFSHATSLTFAQTGTGNVSFQGAGASRSLYIVHANNSVAIGGSTTNPAAFLDVQAATTSRASLRLRGGVDPTSPGNGDIWNDGSDLKIRLGGTTYTLNKTAV